MSIYKMRTEMGHYFKWLLLLVLVPIFVIGGVNYFGGTGAGPERQTSGAEDVIAKVGDDEITRGEFEKTWEQMMDQARQQGVRSALQYADMRMMIFQQLVNDKLVVAAAEQLGVGINDRAVEEQIDKMIVMFLKENRRAVLGKLTPQREAMDPRDDGEYKRELERSGMSLNQQIEMAKSRLPEDQVRAQMAQQAIGQRLQARAKPVNDRDIAASYNHYQIRQIVLQTTGLPKEQASARIAKIQAAVKSGADFGQLAADNSADPMAKKNRGLAQYSFETRQMFPQAVRDAVQKLTPGQVSPAIETPYGVYFVKLESVTPKLPAKLDEKAKQARKQEITQDRQAAAQADFEAEMRGQRRVNVLDPEFLAYWQMLGAMSAAGTPQEFAKQTKLAISSLKKASRVRPNNYVEMHLARLLDRSGQTAEAVRLLYPMLEGKDASVEGADLRILLGDMLLKTGVGADKERAVQQYKTASEVAAHDPQIHQQLIEKYKQINRPDLVAVEQKWITDYAQRLAQIQEMRKKQSPGQSQPKPGE